MPVILDTPEAETGRVIFPDHPRQRSLRELISMEKSLAQWYMSVIK
jgi:hypothetical protein